MGEKQNQPVPLSFNSSLRIDCQGSRVTSDGGLILVRELDERLGFGELIEQHLADSGRGGNTQLPVADLLRQSVYSRLAGYEAAARQRPQCRRLGRTATARGPRGRPAFAKPEIYEAQEERGVKYAIRIPASDSLERDIAELLTRPVGRPSHKPVVWYKSFLHRAASWKTARRVVGKVEFHFGELLPGVGFIVTNLEADSRAVVRFYNKRGTGARWIKEVTRRLFGSMVRRGPKGTPKGTPEGTPALPAPAG